MDYLKKTILPIFLTGIWINISETIKWELLIKFYWIEYYQNVNLVFPSDFVNIIVWMIWGFMCGITIFTFSRKFTILQTTLMSWFVAFVMMWVVVWNIGVLPTKMLLFNIPLSLFEAFIGALICNRISGK